MSHSRSVVRAFVHIAPAVAYVVLIFVMGSMPPGSNPTAGVNDKLVHALGFGALVPLNQLALGYAFARWTPWRTLLTSAVVAGALGGLLELHQLAFTRRSAEVLDWVADLVGIGFVVALMAGYAAWRPADTAPTSEG